MSAAELAEDNGLVAATVEAIAERAGVSRRTFFNYFASKEDAILGLVPPCIPHGALERASVSATDDPARDDVRRAVHLLVITARASRMTVGGFARRRQLVDRFPEFNKRLMHQSQEIQDLVLDELDDQDSALAGRLEGSRDRARALVLLAASVMRFAYENDPRVLEEEDLASFDPSIAVFRSLLKEA